MKFQRTLLGLAGNSSPEDILLLRNSLLSSEFLVKILILFVLESQAYFEFA